MIVIFVLQLNWIVQMLTLVRFNFIYIQDETKYPKSAQNFRFSGYGYFNSISAISWLHVSLGGEGNWRIQR
jgi:hypothetical protein